jgi:23S rRNA pseudouridine1911/1915/1917 synthase
VSGRVVAVLCREATTVGAVLARLGAGAEQALREGRLFVGARRAAGASEPVAAGEEVVVYPPRATRGDEPRILLERAGIVAAYKPAELSTVADHRGVTGTLERIIADKSGHHALTPTSRLDVGVSGVVVFAIDDEARHRLATAREQGRYRRHYVAVARGIPAPSRGEWTGAIGRDRDPRRRRVGGRDALAARTAYAVVASNDTTSLLALEPHTGRTHQIRVHAANSGCPLLGDEAYGGSTRLVTATGAVHSLRRIALHAAWVEIPDAAGSTIRIDASIPDDLAAIWSERGGNANAWGLALAPL